MGPLLLLGYLLLLVRNTGEAAGATPELSQTFFLGDEKVYGLWKVPLYLSGSRLLLTLGRRWQRPAAAVGAAAENRGGGFRKPGF